jgi:hypothetical protein
MFFLGFPQPLQVDNRMHLRNVYVPLQIIVPSLSTLVTSPVEKKKLLNNLIIKYY